MPRWESAEVLGGITHHTLDGGRVGAMVVVDPEIRRTVVSVAIAVDGTDDATVDRCKLRAEQMLATAQKGGRP